MLEFWDNYEHLNEKITYILESIKTKEIEDLYNDNISGCKCKLQCTIENNCLCLKRSGGFYKFLNQFDLSNYTIEIVDQNKPFYECNNNCECCDKICGNKLVQFGPRKNLQIIDCNNKSQLLTTVTTKQIKLESEGKGLGLITTQPILNGSFTCEYAGEIITQTEAKQRFEKYKEIELKMNYIFCINEHFGDNNIKTFIDPTFYGNIGRYINHSCEPNCQLIPIRIQDIVPRLCIFSRETINENTELTFNYGNNNYGTFDEEISNAANRTRCLCSATNCQKFLPFDPLTDDL